MTHNRDNMFLETPSQQAPSFLGGGGTASVPEGGGVAPTQQAKIRSAFASTPKTDTFELLDSDTKQQVAKMLRRPTWDGEMATFPMFELEWHSWVRYWGPKLDAYTLVLTFCASLPKEKKLLYLNLHQQMGWDYKKIYDHIASKGRGLHTAKLQKMKWKESTPSQDKAPEVFALWLLDWQMLATKASPVYPHEIKECFIQALKRSGSYEEELEEVWKAEAKAGRLTTMEGAAKLVQHELEWKASRDAVSKDHTQIRGISTQKGQGKGKGGRGQGKGASNHNPPAGESRVGGEEKKCFRCGNPGHFARNCTSNPPDQQNPPRQASNGKGGGKGKPKDAKKSTTKDTTPKGELSQGQKKLIELITGRIQKKQCMVCGGDHRAQDCTKYK